MSPLLVLFRSAFRLTGEHITHALRADGARTICGRTGWEQSEGRGEPCCIRCRDGLRRRAREAK